MEEKDLNQIAIDEVNSLVKNAESALNKFLILVSLIASKANSACWSNPATEHLATI